MTLALAIVALVLSADHSMAAVYLPTGNVSHSWSLNSLVPPNNAAPTVLETVILKKVLVFAAKANLPFKLLGIDGFVFAILMIPIAPNFCAAIVLLIALSLPSELINNLPLTSNVDLSLKSAPT